MTQLATQKADTAAEGISEGAIEMVRHGYDESRRCLMFRVMFWEGRGAPRACRTIGAYNEFDGEVLAESLEALSEKIRIRSVEVGRELSPVLYVRPYDIHDVGTLQSVLRAAKADEVDIMEGRIIRAWWD